jgi:putative transposase
MMRSRFTEQRIIYALRQVEAGTPAVCRQLECSAVSFYIWKKCYGEPGPYGGQGAAAAFERDEIVRP